MKRLSLISFLLASFFIMQAQTVQYGYDQAGNRISRTIVLASLRSAPLAQADEEKPAIAEQLNKDIEVKIYPNPTEGLLKVEIIGDVESDTPTTLMLFSSQGQRLQTVEVSDAITLVDLSSHKAGIYLLRLTIDNKATDYKIIKR